MPHQIHRVAVIGAGTMGAAIAALVANAGLPVLLLDVPPATLTPDEEKNGLSLASPAVRNRLARLGFERAQTAHPPAFASPAAEQLITPGNTEDELPQLAGVDWIIEAIIEQLSPKLALFERLDAVRRPGSLITTNTSGLPIAQLAAGRSADFKRHFLGAHFFNPPRTMKLLEIIPTPETDPAVVQALSAFATERLDKGVVLCKDTPNFIGNRLFVVGYAYAVQTALAGGYTVAEVDALTGPLLGRPKTATFRLLDLVGNDVFAFIAQNLVELIPHDPYREILRAPQFTALFSELMRRGWLGNKRKQGFYKQDVDAAGQRVFKVLNPATFEYELPPPPHFEALAAVANIDDIGARLSSLLSERWQADRAAKLVRSLLCFDLAYAAAVAPEIAYDLKSIDDDLRWGFNYEVGPFELWDRLGVANMAAAIEAAGHGVAPWVKSMLATGVTHFYRREAGRVTGVYNWDIGRYADLPGNSEKRG